MHIVSFNIQAEFISCKNKKIRQGLVFCNQLIFILILLPFNTLMTWLLQGLLISVKRDLLLMEYFIFFSFLRQWRSPIYFSILHFIQLKRRQNTVFSLMLIFRNLFWISIFLELQVFCYASLIFAFIIC